MKIYSTAFLSMVLAFVFSCSSKVEDKNGNEAFQFDFNRIQSKVNFSVPYSDQWPDISTERQYQFTTCIRDGVFIGGAVYERFEVTFGDQAPQIVLADQMGCIGWTETIEFNFFSRSLYWDVDIKIKGIDRFRGERVIPVLFNPWSAGLFDPRYDDPKRIPAFATSKRALSNMEEAPTENLILDDVKIDVIEIFNRQDHAEALVEIRMVPRFYTVNVNGVPEYRSFTRGCFELQAALVENMVDSGHVVPLSMYQKDECIKVEDRGMIRFRSNMRWDRVTDPNSILEFVFSLKPKDGPERLGFAERMARVGRAPQRGVNQGTVEPLPEGHTMQTYITRDSEFFGFYDGNDRKNFGIGMTAISVYKGAFYDSYSTNPQRTVELLIKSCLYDPITLKPLFQHDIEVAIIKPDSIEEPEYQKVTMEPNGCFQTTGKMTYFMFDTERWMTRYVKARGLSGPYRGIEFSREIYLNPWENSWITFAVDSLRGTPPVVNPEPTRSPEVYLEDISYKFLRNEDDELKVDKFMQMKMTKAFELQLRPQIKQYHNFSGQVDYPRINYGLAQVDAYFLVPKKGKAEFQNIDLKDYRLLSHDSFEGLIENNMLRTPMNFEMNFTDLPQAVLRGLLLLKVSLPDSRVAPGTFITHFDFASSGANFNTLRLGLSSYDSGAFSEFFKDVQITADIDALVEEKQQKEQVDEQINPLELFRQRVLAMAKTEQTIGLSPRFQSLSLEDLNAMAVNLPAGWFDRASQYNRFGESTLKEFCYLVFRPDQHNPSNRHFQRCLREPKQYVDAQATRHIEEILSDPQKEEAQNVGMSLSQSQGINIAFGYSESTSTSRGVSLSAGLSLPKGLGVMSALGPRVGVSYGISHSQSHSRSVGDNQAAGVSFTRSVHTDYLNLSFDAEVNNCVLVQGKKAFLKAPQVSPRVGSMGAVVTSYKPSGIVHICESKPSRQKVSEVWYFIGMSSANGQGMRDGMDLRENPFIQVIRGRRLFRQYYERLTESNMVHFLFQVDNDLMKERYFDLVRKGETRVPYEMFADNSFPGLLDVDTY